MKFALVAAASVLACGTANAQKIEVPVPADLSTPVAAEAYTKALITAVDQVCARETGPVIGVSYYTFRECVKQTRLHIASTEPTGLLARQLGLSATMTVAAR